jgi:uncharacterized protein YbgA (DUF1722 family)
LQGVKVYLPNGHPNASGRGVFADELIKRYPLLPVEDSGRLMDAGLRENFVQRVFIYHDWCETEAQGWTPARLIEFHARNKFLLLAHHPKFYRELGCLLADFRNSDLSAISQRYIRTFMQAIAKPATRGGHSNALMHINGYLKSVLVPQERQALHDIVEQYRVGDVPLVVPVTMLRHYLNKHQDTAVYAVRQTYLSPYPAALRLRNEI